MSRRKTHGERMDTARDAAWKQYGAKNYRWIVGLHMFWRWLPALVLGGLAFLFLRWTAGLFGDGSAGQGQSAGLSAAWLALILLAVSALGLATLAVYRWANPGRRSARFWGAAAAFLLLFAAAILWLFAAL